MTHSPDHPQRPTGDSDDEDAIDLPFLTDAVRAAAADEEQAGYPVVEWYLGQPVPDLNEIEQDRWREVLTPLTQPVRNAAARRMRSMEAGSTNVSPRPPSASAPSPGSSPAS